MNITIDPPPDKSPKLPKLQMVDCPDCGDRFSSRFKLFSCADHAGGTKRPVVLAGLVCLKDDHAPVEKVTGHIGIAPTPNESARVALDAPTAIEESDV